MYDRLYINTVRLRIFVGWVEQSETQQMSVNVEFRPSTQPTRFHDFELNRKVLDSIFQSIESIRK